MLTAVVGIQWGDEGKGRMVDLLSADYDVICRYQGGNNAGHTVVNPKGRFILNLLPSGVLREGTQNLLGGGMVVDIEHLCGEIQALKAGGIALTPESLRISDRAMICMPWHVRQDILEEERLGSKKFGSTRRGIAPAYGDRALKKGLRMGDMLSPDTLEEKVRALVEWKNVAMHGYGQRFSDVEVLGWLKEYGSLLTPYIIDATAFLSQAVADRRDILFEAQLGALRDLDYGIYPYSTSSYTLASYAPIGAGIPGAKLDRVVGIMKAYSTCVGEGPFTAEMFGDAADSLREAGEEYGAATGRPRRVGGFDIPASRFGVRMQGATELALTKLDVLSYLPKIPVCVAYDVNGARTTEFPSGDRLAAATPIYEEVEGFSEDISNCRSQKDLPAAARRYIQYLEDAVNCPIRYVSVGPGRDDYLIME